MMQSCINDSLLSYKLCRSLPALKINKSELEQHQRTVVQAAKVQLEQIQGRMQGRKGKYKAKTKFRITKSPQNSTMLAQNLKGVIESLTFTEHQVRDCIRGYDERAAFLPQQLQFVEVLDQVEMGFIEKYNFRRQNLSRNRLELQRVMLKRLYVKEVKRVNRRELRKKEKSLIIQ